MRRLLTALAAAIPLAAAGQTLPATGAIIFNPDAVINLEECTDAGLDLGLKWTTAMESGWTFASGGRYRVFAASKDQGTSNPFCYRADETGVFADELVTVPGEPSAANQAYTASWLNVKAAAAAAATVDDATTDPCAANRTIYLCVLWYDTVTGTTPHGYAKATLSLRVEAPAAPEIRSVTPGEKALNVNVADGGGSVDSAEFRASAVAAPGYEGQDPDTHWSSRRSDGELRVEGLLNDVPYVVTAYAYSDEGNESDGTTFGTAVAPKNVSDAWELYHAVGRDDGGCQAGGAGLLALLAAAALLRLGRRP